MIIHSPRPVNCSSFDFIVYANPINVFQSRSIRDFEAWNLQLNFNPYSTNLTGWLFEATKASFNSN